MWHPICDVPILSDDVIEENDIEKLKLAVNVLAWELEKASYCNEACCNKMNWNKDQWKDYALNYKCPDDGM